MEIAGPLPQMMDTRVGVYLARGDAAKAQADLDAALADVRGPERLFHQARRRKWPGGNRKPPRPCSKPWKKA